MDGSIQATIANDGNSVIVADARTNEIIFTLKHEGLNPRIWSVAISPDRSYIATGGRDGTARLWDGHTGQFIKTIHQVIAHIWSVAFSADGRFLATSDLHGNIELWNIWGGGHQKNVGQLVGNSSSFQNPPGVVVTFSEDGYTLYANEISAGTVEFDLSSEY